MRIVFDHGTPSGIARALASHDVTEEIERGWDRISNGEPLKSAEAADFDLLPAHDRQRDPVSAKSDGPENSYCCAGKFHMASCAAIP